MDKTAELLWQLTADKKRLGVWLCCGFVRGDLHSMDCPATHRVEYYYGC